MRRSTTCAGTTRHGRCRLSWGDCEAFQATYQGPSLLRGDVFDVWVREEFGESTRWLVCKACSVLNRDLIIDEIPV